MGAMGQTEHKDLGGDTNDGLAKPTFVRYQVLGVACILAIVIYIHRVGFSAAAPDIKTELGLSPTAHAWLFSIFLLAYGAVEIPWGLLGDRFGVRLVLTVVALGWSAATAGLALIVFLPANPSLQIGFLLTMRFIFGMFQAGAFPAISRMLADWMPMQERATAQGIIWMCTRAGGALAPFLIVYMIAHLHSWTLPLVLVSFLGVFWCLFFWPWFRNQPEQMPQVNEGERAIILGGRSRVSAAHGQVPWLKVIRSRSMWALCITYGCGGFAANFYINYLPTYLRDFRGMTPDQTKWMSSMPLACGIVGCVLGGYVSDWIIRRTGNRKWGRRLTGTIGTLTAGLGYLSINWIHNPWVLGVVLCIIFFSNDIAMGPIWACCADIGRRYAGTIGGAMNMIGNLAGAAGSAVAGFYFDKLVPQPETVFVIYACSFWLGTICWQGVDVTKPIEAEN
jgi:ACS family glucarate transporter-like MFS transporter